MIFAADCILLVLVSCAQEKMKKPFDRKTESRLFETGDQVLALLPVVGSPFEAKVSGP